MYDGIASARRRGVVAAGAACAGDVFLQQHLCNDSSQSKTCLLVILAVFNRRHKQSRACRQHRRCDNAHQHRLGFVTKHRTRVSRHRRRHPGSRPAHLVIGRNRHYVINISSRQAPTRVSRYRYTVTVTTGVATKMK